MNRSARAKTVEAFLRRAQVWSIGRALFEVLLVVAMASLGFTHKAIAEEIALDQLPGARIDANWFRYTNRKAGVAIDIPTQGFRYDVPAGGSDLTLTSLDGAVTITVSAHGVRKVLGTAPNDARQSIARLFDTAVDNAIRKNGAITYKVKKDNFFVLSGVVDNNTYYERLNISPSCPSGFSALRVFHRKSLTSRLNRLVTRMSLSLRATCQAEEGPA
jgi:hypothetical protein